MLYREFREETLSALGFGCMRLPKNGEEDTCIDEAAAEEMVDYALEKGVNYFDTAWMYHGGRSEEVLGRLLNRHPRESYCIADKFPSFNEDFMKDPKKTFETQLNKTGMEYFDFYLFHNVYEKNIDWFLNPEYGVVDYIAGQKAAGRIRHLGFSCHGGLETMKRFLDACGEHLEFGMIQLNWLDWTFQKAAEKVELLRAYGLDVWVMEPLRGGKLVRLSEKDMARLDALRPGESPARWGLRFVRNVPGVKMILSGMSNLEQMKENIACFEQEDTITPEEWNTLVDMGARMAAGIPCTDCRYCADQCPQGLNIPGLLEEYNRQSIEEEFELDLPAEKQPGACVGCHACENVCPQKIKIAEVLAGFAEKLKG